MTYFFLSQYSKRCWEYFIKAYNIKQYRSLCRLRNINNNQDWEINVYAADFLNLNLAIFARNLLTAE